jgi:hypothetical protein
MSGRQLILITDGLTVHEWQRRALEMLPAEDRITVFACTNTRLKRQWAKHCLYYALNMVTVRNALTRQVPFGDIGGRLVSVTQFESDWDGNWQRLPAYIADAMANSGADAVLKFGMGLMRVPEGVTMPILSYHHGDPDHYRGRPAGFWEMANGTPLMGQMVQSISNKLDAGEVLAFAETRVIRHSWRKTLMESFRHSPLLLNIALANVLAGRKIAKERNGKNYRLPSNAAVAMHIVRTGWIAVKRIAYGLLAEKYWRVAMVDAGNDALALATSQRPFPAHGEWDNLATPAGYSFLADPFFAPDGSLLVEALDAKNGLGALLHIGGGAPAKISLEPGHHSYPSVVEEDGQHYCIPEIADWSVPLVYPMKGTGSDLHFGEARALDIPDPSGLTDPTFVRWDGRLWLFANRKAEGSNILRLWSADSLFARFAEHPQSPIRISPNGGRMAGNLLASGGRLYRLGQNFETDYGDGTSVFEIETLDDQSYAEHRIGGLRFTGVKGPHSFNLSPDGKKIVFDWYSDRYTPMAGIRRLRSRLKI